ncbi:short chain dehydrogenase/oxidoreductase, putative [Paecilomyces variotii No. 5]|uniref:Short chain dehydrogenase/oxidoreductase, putative n=1 Tax=Byssochlamys spectabilis (strain No. 5 / NBRC 109023) TaxID=1356009 RepID=V5FT27_BYSSN|nr:short chain dehydrogenase/oxidoreductase, putative [Paecilomyces variotii No. 5]
MSFMISRVSWAPRALSVRTISQASSLRAGYATTSNIQTKLPGGKDARNPQRFREFNLENRTFAVTGGARGLGLSMAEALMEAGAKVYCLDRLEKPDDEFAKAQDRAAKSSYGGALEYRHIDVRDHVNVNNVMAEIAAQSQRLDGMIAAAGINHLQSALEHSQEALEEVMHINYNGVFNSATAAARQMFHYKSNGSILLVASMSGVIANKGMSSPVYNSSKAAVIQLARCLAMEWGRHGIRVNSLCPGHIVTPMVEMVFDKTPEVRTTWEAENMLGRLAKPEEFRGAALFALSDASSFMTGSTMLIDGGHTAW